MQIAVFQFVVFAHQQITEELFKIFRLLLDSLSHILVIGTDERVPEIPRILGENVVPDLFTAKISTKFGICSNTPYFVEKY